MQSKSNQIWSELCKELPYVPAYAISHLLDPSIFHFINNVDHHVEKLTFFIIYDAMNETKRLLMFDNGLGYSRKEITNFINYETIGSRG